VRDTHLRRTLGERYPPEDHNRERFTTPEDHNKRGLPPWKAREELHYPPGRLEKGTLPTWEARREVYRAICLLGYTRVVYMPP